ncbi:MAG TPA: hypothetical protein VJB66_03335 [Candidatus Nanoarchaeia archaeon]|nr:hypothetical protein [Candidatus Nanoarchaeia archaeon]
MEKTTIQITKQTLERLQHLKKFERQSYDDVLNNVFDDIEDEVLSQEEITEIQQGLEDVRKGRVYPIEKIAKELGIKLK